MPYRSHAPCLPQNDVVAAVGPGGLARALLLPGRVVLPAGRRRPRPGLVPDPGVGRHRRAGGGGARPAPGHGHVPHEQRPLPAGVRLCPLLALHAQRRVQGAPSPGRRHGGGGHHHPLPEGPLRRGGLRAAQPHRHVGREVVFPRAEVRVHQGRAGVRRDVLQAERHPQQSRQDHAASVQEEGRPWSRAPFGFSFVTATDIRFYFFIIIIFCFRRGI